MKQILPLIALSLIAAPAIAAEDAAAPAVAQATVAAVSGKMLVDGNGARLAPVNRVTADGSAQILFQGRVVTVPASTLSIVDGKLATSLKKSELLARR